MKKSYLALGLLVQILVGTANADISKLKCELDLVKKDGSFSVLAEGKLKMNGNVGKFDTFKAGENGLDSNPYRVELLLSPDSDQKYVTNVELLDRTGSANSSFFTISDGSHIITSLTAKGNYKVLGDENNYRIYLECK